MNVPMSGPVIANSYLEVDLSAVCANARSICASLAPGTKLVPVLKGNAYGLGAVPVARALGAVPGIGTFAVSHVSEGLELRASGITQEIWTLSLALPHQLRAAAEADLVLTLGSLHQLPLLRETAEKLQRPVLVQIKLDTGLQRIGFPEAELPELLRVWKEYAPYLTLRGVFSHFADGQRAHMDAQFACFLRGADRLQQAGIEVGVRHIASSAPVELTHDYDLDAVRIGRRLYMDSPIQPTGGITEPVSFRAYLADVRLRHAGETLGYGGAFRLLKDTRVGVLSVGYGDGIPEALYAVHSPVLIRGQEAHLLTTCMDQSFVDLGAVDAAPGDEVTVFGRDREGNFLSSQTVAAQIGSNEGCGLTAALLPRVQRIYTGGKCPGSGA